MAAEYVRGVNAGAAICHLHGPYTVDKEIQPDGKALRPRHSRLAEAADRITSKVDTVIQ